MRDTSPSSRKEGYREDILKKLEYIAELEKKIKADAVVLAGDVFHFPTPSKTSHATVLRMLEVIQKFNNIYVVYGNHDLASDRVESVLEKQPLGVLIHGGLKVLDGWHDTLPLYGIPWQQDWIINEHAPARAFMGFRQGASHGRDLSHSLAVTHAPIYPPAEQQSVIFELLPTSGENSIAKAMGRQGYLYYGHIHEDHGVFEDGGITYCNVGGLSRGSLHEYNLERDIQVAIWDSSKGFRPHVIPYKPASELFLIDEHQAKREEAKSLDKFLNDVSGTKIEISSIESVKTHIRELPDIDAKVKDKAVSILDSVN